MKNNLVVIRFVVLLSTALYVRCASNETKKYCKSLAENGGRISYAISAPQSPEQKHKHRFYVVIKDHYWELEMYDLGATKPANPANPPEVSNKTLNRESGSTVPDVDPPKDTPPNSPPNPSTTGTGLKLKSKLHIGIKFDSSSVESEVGFAVRMGETANNAFVFISDKWKKYRWYEIPQSTKGLPDIDAKEALTVPKDFGQDFEPNVAFNPYSHNNSVVLIHQKPSPKNASALTAQIHVYDIKDPSKWQLLGSSSEKDDKVPPKLYPAALVGLCKTYYIRGLFGYEAKRAITRFGVINTDIVSAMVLLIEECESGHNCTNPTYKYCASPEIHENPFALHCNKTTLKELVDCSKGDPEGEVEDEGGDEGEVPNPDADSDVTDGDTSGSTAESSESSGSSKSWLWIILILIIIFIIIIIILLLFCCKGKGEDKPTGKTPASAPKSSAATPGAGTGNNESLATSSNISTRSNTG